MVLVTHQRMKPSSGSRRGFRDKNPLCDEKCLQLCANLGTNEQMVARAPFYQFLSRYRPFQRKKL